MRKELAAVLTAGLVLVGGAVFTANSAMAEVDDCKTYVSENVTRPDSGHNGNWATDTFTRTVKVCLVATNQETEATGGGFDYKATITDAGTFVTTEGAKSPGAGEAVNLPKGITGKFTGSATYLFKTTAEIPGTQKPYTTNGDWPSTAEWIKKWLGSLVVSGNYADDGKAWGWTYDTGCEKWTNAGAGESGNITAKCAAPTDPKVTKATCKAAGELVIPQVVGVKYTTTTKPNGKVTVRATAKPGYVLPAKDGGWVWTLTIPAKLPADSDECKEPTTPPTTTPPTTPPTNNPGGGGGDPTPSQTTEAPAGGNNDDGGELALTGSSKGTLFGMLGIGGLLVSVGGLLMFGVRRRKVAGTVESA